MARKTWTSLHQGERGGPIVNTDANSDTLRTADASGARYQGFARHKDSADLAVLHSPEGVSGGGNAYDVLGERMTVITDTLKVVDRAKQWSEDGAMIGVSYAPSRPGRAEISVFGEVFLLDRDPDLGLVLQHPKWSLMGYGKTIFEAEKLLIERGRALGSIMKDDFPLRLGEEGARIRDFVIRLLYLRSVSSP